MSGPVGMSCVSCNRLIIVLDVVLLFKVNLYKTIIDLSIGSFLAVCQFINIMLLLCSCKLKEHEIQRSAFY